MYCFFVKAEQVGNDRIRILGPDVNHIKNVLRMKHGEAVRISDGTGCVYDCRIDTLSEDEVTAEIESSADGTHELPVRITLFQGVPKSDKLELVIQKAVELGVSEIVPVSMKRCVAKIEPKKEEAKLKRYRSIAESAAKQSGRDVIPEVSGVMTLKEAVKYASTMEHTLVPYECAENMAHTREVVGSVKPGERVAVFIGPEGGFEESEIALLEENGAKIITLGPRILRTETAPLYILSVLGFCLS